jgi:hypothetical protein
MSSKMTRKAATVALAGAAGAMMALTVAGPVAAAPHGRGPELVSNRLPAVKANTASWVNLYWRTNTPVCSARVQVDGGRQVAVAYPGMRRTTTFTGGDTLRPGRTAATPFRVTPVRQGGSVALLRAVMSYTDCGRHARTQWKRVNLALPVLRNLRPMPGNHWTPGQGQPGHAQPGHSQPGLGLPGHAQPGHTQPGHGQPGLGQPGHTQPGHGQPGLGLPGHGQPGHGPGGVQGTR